jgi:hypothetical protein
MHGHPGNNALSITQTIHLLDIVASDGSCNIALRGQPDVLSYVK